MFTEDEMFWELNSSRLKSCAELVNHILPQTLQVKAQFDFMESHLQLSVFLARYRLTKYWHVLVDIRSLHTVRYKTYFPQDKETADFYYLLLSLQILLNRRSRKMRKGDKTYCLSKRKNVWQFVLNTANRFRNFANNIILQYNSFNWLIILCALCVYKAVNCKTSRHLRTVCIFCRITIHPYAYPFDQWFAKISHFHEKFILIKLRIVFNFRSTCRGKSL